MLGQTIWWSCIALETLLLVRGFAGRLWARYPVFYAYISFVWLQSLLRFSIFHSRPQLYAPVYWITEWLGVLIGCGVVLNLPLQWGLLHTQEQQLGWCGTCSASCLSWRLRRHLDSWNDPQ
jgi:hypothetical protein